VIKGDIFFYILGERDLTIKQLLEAKQILEASQAAAYPNPAYPYGGFAGQGGAGGYAGSPGAPGLPGRFERGKQFKVQRFIDWEYYTSKVENIQNI